MPHSTLCALSFFFHFWHYIYFIMSVFFTGLQITWKWPLISPMVSCCIDSKCLINFFFFWTDLNDSVILLVDCGAAHSSPVTEKVGVTKGQDSRLESHSVEIIMSYLRTILILKERNWGESSFSLDFAWLKWSHSYWDKSWITSGVPSMTQRKWIQIGTMRLGVQSLASLSGLRIRCCCELWYWSQTRLGSQVAVA